MEKISATVKYSDINLAKDQMVYLTFEHDCLVPCEVINGEDEFEMIFTTDGLKMFSNLEECTLTEKYKALSNIAKLYKMRKEYSFSINPENLMYDRDFNPYVLKREGPEHEDDFINEYKALTATVLYPKYKYEDYRKGGTDLYDKKVFLRKISKAETVEELHAILEEEYEKQENYIKEHKMLVNKKSFAVCKALVPILSVLALVFAAAAGIMALYKIPYTKRLVEANEAYIAEDYIKTQKALSEIELTALPVSEKYILARSYIITESLTAAQKENVLIGITLKTDERVLNYWIELGRLNFESAYDYAKRLGDDELLLFAMIKESASIKDNTDLAGEEKSDKLASLEENINRLSEKMKSENENPVQENSEIADEVKE